MRWYTVVLAATIFLFVATYVSQSTFSAASTAAKGPENIILDGIANKYEPVNFSHEMHTEVVDGCAKCHHTPPGETLACSDCHGPPFDPENLSKPGLKGAYHRQCIGCHRDSESGPMGCTDCHAKRGAAK